METLNQKRGYLTIALGDWFVFLAKNLITSYLFVQEKRREEKSKYPFAVITDAKGAKKLEGLFDTIVIYEKTYVKGYLSKLDMYEYSPFEETIFIDADSLFIRNTDDWFDIFEKSNQPFCVWGKNIEINKPEITEKIQSGCWHYPQKTIDKYNIKYTIGFNGGCYYFVKSPVAAEIFSRARELCNSYIEDGLHLFANNSLGDEPVMEIAMIEHNIKAIEDKERTKMYCTPGMTKLQIDVLQHLCSFYKYDIFVTPSIMHWGTNHTKNNPLYRREVLKLGINQRYPGLSTRVCIFMCNAFYPLIWSYLLVVRLIKKVIS